MVDYKYCVVKMRLPNKDYDEFVCIASCWIVHRRKMDQTVIVNYPTDENVKTIKRLKKKIGDPGDWRLLKAEVKYGTDSYELAKTFINSRKNNTRGKSLPVINCSGLNDDINSSSNHNNEKKLNNRHSKEKNKDVIPSKVSKEQLRIANQTIESNLEIQTLTSNLNTNEKSVTEKASKRTSNSEQKLNNKRSKITTETSSSNVALEQSSKQTKAKQLSHIHEVESVNSECTQPISDENSHGHNTKIIENSAKDIPKASTSKYATSSNLDEDSKQNHDHKQNDHVLTSVVSSSPPNQIQTKVKNIPETQSAGSHPTSRIEDNNQTYNVTSSNITTNTHNEDETIIERRMNYNFGQMLFNLLNIPDHKQLIIKYRDIMDAVFRCDTGSTNQE